MSLLDTYIKEMYSDLSGADNVLDVIGTVNPFRLASSVFTSPFADKPDPAVGSADSKGNYYAGEKFDYQSPDSYKKIFGAFPKAYIDKINKTTKDDTRVYDDDPSKRKNPDDIGGFRSTDNKYYTGENYGYQSPDSYNKVVGSYPAGYVKPSTGTAMPGNKMAPISNTVSETKTPTSLGGLEGLADKLMANAEKQAAASFYRTQQQADKYAQYSMEKSKENTTRQIELENIKRWREIELAKIEAQTRSAALTTGLMTMLQQPNANFINALSTASQSAASAFNAGRGRGG